MSLRLSHLTTLTISLTWVARFTLPSTRCERSPNPVIVGVNTFARSFADGRPRAASTSRRAKRRARARRSWARRSAPLLAGRPKRLRSRRLLRSPARRGGSSLRRWLRSSCPPYALSFGPILLEMRPFVPNSANGKWVGMLGLAALPGQPAPVDNRDNRPPSRQRPARVYTGRSSESPGQLHALSASVSRRAARAASSFGGRGPARAAQEGGA